MTQEKLNNIISDHKHWLKEDCADWKKKKADLSGADLHDADLHGANLRCADLRDANLRCADLHDADLRGADLHGANLRGADIRGANIRGADLHDADLHGANLRGADIRGANISCANLRGADIRDAKYDKSTSFFALQCPEDGSFTGFKKVCKEGKDYIVKLLVPSDAKRSSATSRKCRCDKAEVLSILNTDGSDSHIDEIYNCNYGGITYKVGEMAFADGWDEDRWNECSNGIHFFITFQEAVDY